MERAIHTSRRHIFAAIGDESDVTFVRSTGNIGDQLIFAGTRRLLAGIPYREVGLEEARSQRGRLALVSGGGSWGPAYHYLATIFPDFERQFDRVILLPSSFDPSVEAVSATLAASSATIFARERKSLEAVRALQPGARLAVDMACFFDFAPYRRLAGRGTLLAYRTDLEAAGAPVPADNRDISALADSLDQWLWEIATHGRIYTDRAHVLIAAMLLGKEVVYRPSNYHKLDGIAHRFRDSARLPESPPPADQPSSNP